MTDILINCDIGERGVENTTDLAIMPHIHIANVACGGHAGDDNSARFFADLARRHAVIVAAHLSYPGRENFGRTSMEIDRPALVASLDAQMARLPGVAWVKFHGALYNDACAREPLAKTLADWAARRRITHILTPGDSALSTASRDRGLHVVAEFFAERRYALDEHGRLHLVPRSKPYASIHDCGEALEQVRRFVETGGIEAIAAEHPDGSFTTRPHPISAETICVHSDSPIALDLIQRMTERGFGRKKR
jgi:5-oxoprolinase (ATP-hydrolysing) subunit A